VPEIAADLDDVEALSRAFGVAWDRVEAAQHRFRRAAITGEALGRPDLTAAYQGAYGSTVAAVETLRQSGCGRPTARERPTSMSGRSRTCCSDSVPRRGRAARLPKRGGEFPLEPTTAWT
jgi:hypothetical protein